MTTRTVDGMLAPRSVAVVLGTRPELVKSGPLVKLLGDAALVVHTGQHYDENLRGQFLAELAPALGGFTRAAEQRLERHAWPGNVRELRNAVQHGAALARGPYVDVEDLPEDLGVAPAAAGEALRSLADVEREHVLRVLDACGGSQADAARVLGIGRNTLWRKLRGYSASA